jgi:uncharacterized protein
MSFEGPPQETQSAKSKGLWLAAVFGLAFGFLLQKGGVAKFNVLIGVLLLEDFTVVKLMVTAITVGMLGVFALHSAGKVQLHIKPTRLGSQVIGGLVFGVGFGLLAYCPGTGAAALGQGNWDALFGFFGLMVGSYLFAETSGFLSRTLDRWGEKGKLTLPDLLGVPPVFVVAAVTILLTTLLVVLERFTDR